MSAAAELAVYETFEDIFGTKSTFDELVADIKCFGQQSVLWVCAVIVTGTQLWNQSDFQPPDVYIRLISLFFDPGLRPRLIAGYWSSDPRRVLFHRRQILLIAKLAILHCTGRGIDARVSPERFGQVLLKANDHFHYGLLTDLAGSRVSERDDYARIVMEMLATGESTSPHIGNLITRNHLMLTRFADELRGEADFVEVAVEHEQATGLTIEEFEALIFAVLSRFGEETAKKLFADPGVLPLKEANFGTVAVAPVKTRAFVDSLAADPVTMAEELRQRDNGPNDLTIFRKFPLVQQYYNLHLTTAWCGFLMLDGLLLVEKIQTGPYWNANRKHGLRLHKFWGAVFERYVNELMRQACAGTKATFIPDPRAAGNPDVQICDGIVASGDSIVLIEYKSSMFRADTKYAGKYSVLAAEVEKKLVYDKEDAQRKGVAQLTEAVLKLFGPTTGNLAVPGIDLKVVKRVYLYIVTLDSIGGAIGMSSLLNTFLDELLDRSLFQPVEIRPLFCSDIEGLEAVSGFFKTTTLPQILEQWFATNPPLTMPLLALDLAPLPWPGNEWLGAEWRNIFKTMVRILFPDKNPDVAIEEAQRRTREWQRRQPTTT